MGSWPQRSQNFWDPLHTPKWFDLQQRNLVWQYPWGLACVYGVRHSPSQREAWPQRPQFLGDFFEPSTVLHEGTQYEKRQNFVS